MPFKLRCALFGHSLDVRSLATTEEGWIISTSRDKTAKVWKPNGFNCGFTEAATLQGHTNFVSCVCIMPPLSNYPDGLIVTGGSDKKICVFHPTEFHPLFVLEDHKDNVCSVCPGVTSGFLLSSSWDKTSKVWNVTNKRCVLTLAGHSLAVWSALQMAAGAIVTGSADCTIRVYSPDGTYLRSLNGHKDCVRGLAALSSVELISCANDATIRKWNVNTGENLDVYYGHGHYIYSIVVGDGKVVSGGEDRSVRVWTGKEAEVILLPVQSVWAVARLRNGDIVTGTNDGVVRVFSAEPSRQADQATLISYDEDEANFGKIVDQEIGGIKISDLPGREALCEPGNSDGQTKMIREGSSVTCYSWSAGDGQWTKIGDVMGAQAAASKTLYKGKEYDFVFSVDIEDGKPPLKLPYNHGEDPWTAAQKFIHNHNLSQHFLDTVANFIVTNSKSDNSSLPAPSGAVDPFTGGARYVPGGVGSGSSAGAVDPFTGGIRYVTNGRPSSTATLFPHVSYVRFDQGNLQAILDKLQEFNPVQSTNVPASALQGVVKLGDLGAELDMEAITNLQTLLNWPPEVVFPVLDITRLALRNAAINNYLCKEQEGNQLFSIMEQHLLPTALPTNQMLALRISCNMMSHPHGETLVLSKRHYLLAMVRQLASAKANKTLQIALMTVLLNLSVGVLRVNDMSCTSEVIASITLLLPWLPEPEAVLRGLVALGTLLHHSDSLYNDVTPEALTRLRSLAAGPTTEPTASKIATGAAQILQLLKQ